MNLPLFLLGYETLETDRANVEALLNLCLRRGLSVSDFAPTDGGGIRFRIGAISAHRLARDCAREGIPLRRTVGGLPARLLRLGRRAGLVAGLAVAVFLLVLSQKFVWSVRVGGNERLTAGEIRQLLSEQGLEVGSYVPSLRMGEIETRALLLSDDLAWLAIHMDGTVAVVQVVERSPEPAKNDKPANLVAERDGTVEGLELYRGRAMVHIGQPVRAGELLVSGVYDSATVGYRYTRANGRVLARTERVFRVEIPLSYEQKVYGESSRAETVLNFFKFSLKFSKNSRNPAATCDIIETTTGEDWLGMRDLPVSILRRTYLPYTQVTAERSPKEALELAWEELERRLSELSNEVQPVGKRVAASITDTALVLECRLDCVENIAVPMEFEVVE